MGSANDLLSGWKEIATHMGVSVKTAQRLRKVGLPVHQPMGKVIAYRAELDEWLKRPPEQAPQGGRGSEQSLTDGIPSVTPTGRNQGGRWLWRGLTGVVGLAVIYVVWGWISQLLWPGPRIESDIAQGLQGQTFRFRVRDFGMAGVRRWTRAPDGGEAETNNPTLFPDSRGEIRFAFSPDCSTKVGAHQIFVVDLATRLRSNRVNIKVLPEPRCSGPLPDLVAETILVSRNSMTAGEELSVSLLIRNQGVAPSPSCSSRLRLSTSPRSAPTDLVLRTFVSPGIAVGDIYRHSFDITIPSSIEPGFYFITTYVDYLGTFLESNNDNNTAVSERIAILPPR
jgi:CARDB protein